MRISALDEALQQIRNVHSLEVIVKSNHKTQDYDTFSNGYVKPRYKHIITVKLKSVSQ